MVSRRSLALRSAAAFLAAVAVSIALVLSPPVAAAGNPVPPTVAMGEPEAVSTGAATLNGVVSAGGAPATVQFEYGTTAGYGLSTASVELPADASAQQIRIEVTGLTAGTTYHVRMVASNAAGRVQGLDRAFTTAGLPRAPYAETRSAINLTSTGATLLARVRTRSQPTTVYWEYGPYPASTYGLRTAAQTLPAGTGADLASLAVAGLDANTQYGFRAVAVNSAGTARGRLHVLKTTRGITALTMKLAARHVTWSQRAFVGGKVSGLSVNAVNVTLWRQDHPFTAPFRPVASSTASQDGTYGFTTGPLYWATRFRVTADTPAGIGSPTATTLGDLLTKLQATRRKGSAMQLRGLVYPATAGTAVIQRRTPAGRWIKVHTATLSKLASGNRSTFRVWVPRLSTRSARYRAVVAPKDGGAHAVTSTRSTVVARR